MHINIYRTMINISKIIFMQNVQSTRRSIYKIGPIALGILKTSTTFNPHINEYLRKKQIK